MLLEFILKIFKVKQKELLRFFFSYQKKYLSLAIWASLLLLLNVLLMQFPMPLFTRYLIDKIIPAGDFRMLNIMCLVLLGVIIFSQISSYFYRYLVVRFKTRVHYDLERDLYLHVQHLPMSYFSRRSSGYILSRISEISSAETMMADTFLNMAREALTMIGGAVLIVYFHFKLGLISLIILPFFVFSVKVFHKHIKEINKKLKEENAQYTGKLEKNINSIEKIKSSVKEEKIGNRLMEKLSCVLKLRVKSQMIHAFAAIVAGFIGVLAPFILLWYGASEIMSGNLSLGTYFAMNSYLAYLYGPARRLTDVGYQLSQAMAGLERIYEVFQENQEDQGGEAINEIREIVFEDVNFSYNKEEDATPILNNLNFKIKKGERIAVVGESGQGKSTLVKMLLKFYRPDSGSIQFSGMDITTIAVKSLRRRIAYISQSQRLLEDEFSERVKEPGVLDLLTKFRLGKSIDSEKVHQTEFSGGELQKIELMEAILDNADVLIVDEGTSNIDYNSEKIVLEELFSKYSDKIVIFIAHRLNSVTDFPRIAVIDKGRVAEEGTHSELIEKEGRYHFLWGIQKTKQKE